jgi:hypothetical protein
MVGNFLSLVQVVQAGVTSDELAQVLFHRDDILNNNSTPGYETNGYLDEYPTCYYVSQADPCRNLKDDTGLNNHAGIDFRAKTPFKVFSPVSGTVTYSCHNSTTSGKLTIYVEEGDYTLILLHLSYCDVETGRRIHAGEYLGKTGSRATTVPHLHVETRKGNTTLCCACSGPGNTCPFGGNVPTPEATIAAQTYNPLEIIRSIVFLRDTNNKLQVSTISQNNTLRLKGLNFGEQSGQVRIYVDMSEDQEYLECKGDPPFFSYSANIIAWGNTEIEAKVFPHTETACNKNYLIRADNLKLPMLFQVITNTGLKSNIMPFPFKDIRDFKIIKNPQWYAKRVLSLWRNGLVNGYLKAFPNSNEQRAVNLYRPHNAVTKAEVLKMVMASAQIELGNTNCSCANDEHWARAYICTARTLGWIGENDCPYDADTFAKREYVAHLITKLFDIDTGAFRFIPTPFSDVDMTHPYYANILFSKMLGIFAGYPDGSFGLGKNITRAETAKVIDEAFLDSWIRGLWVRFAN